MRIESSSALLHLPCGAALRLQDARGMRLTGRAGRLWVTEEGLSQDVFLHAAESYVVRGSGRVVVGADTEAALVLQPGGLSGRAGRLPVAQSDIGAGAWLPGPVRHKLSGRHGPHWLGWLASAFQPSASRPRPQPAATTPSA